MCRIPKVAIVAPPDKVADLRRALSSLEYDIVTDESIADVAIAFEPDEALVQRLRNAGLKVASIGGSSGDLDVDPHDIASFKSRIFELFRPAR